MNRALLDKGRRLYERALFLLGQSDALIQRSQDELARGRRLLQQHTKRRASRSVLPLIRLKLQDGRLPRVSAPIILGGRGGGRRRAPRATGRS